MTLKTVLAASALALALAAPAAAQQAKLAQQGQGGKMFQRIDTDGDGRISQEEAQVPRDKRFNAMDLDGDGAIGRRPPMIRQGRVRRLSPWASRRFNKTWGMDLFEPATIFIAVAPDEGGSPPARATARPPGRRPAVD